MSDKEFIKLYKEVLSQMKPIYDSSYNELLKKIKLINLYVEKNPYNIYVIDFINELIKKYNEIFFNKNLIDFLYLDNDKYYHNQIQIYKNLPYTTHPLYAKYLIEMLPIPDDYNEYLAFEYILEKYDKKNIKNMNGDYLKLILNFVNNNQTIMKGKKDKHYTIEKEIKNYFSSKNNIYFRGFKEFSYDENLIDAYEIQSKFLNKTLEHIGKLYVFNLIRCNFYTYFVSRDINDGFGYDIYCYGKDYIEDLINVKTTIKNSENDSFVMSENEYKVMMESCNKNNCRYIVCRVFLDNKLNPSYTYLTMKYNDILTSIDDDNIQYKISSIDGNNICFKKIAEKTKKIILP